MISSDRLKNNIQTYDKLMQIEK